MAKNKENEAVEAEATEQETVEETIDLTEFEAAVETAISEADDATGDLSEVQIAQVAQAYQALDGIKPKNAAKAHLQEVLKMSVANGNINQARSVMVLTEKATVAAKSSAPKREVNPAEVHTTTVARLTLALYLAQSAIPEDLDKDSIVASATEKANEVFPEAVEVMSSEDGETENALVKTAIKMARTKVRGGGARQGSGERRDLGAHITAAFAAAKKGDFLTVADIRNAESDIYPADEKPSAGAITNRLEPKSGKPTSIEGITVERRDGKLGGVKN